MSVIGVELTGHEITFCVREYEGKPVQHLTIVPVGFVDYQDNMPGADLVLIEVRLCILRSQIIVDDRITVASLERLQDILLGFQKGGVEAGTVGTAEGQLELMVEWREATQDIRFAGRIPGFDFTELVDEPLRLRDAIYRTLSFQFALEPSALARPLAQLNGLLARMCSLKSLRQGAATRG